MQRTNLLIIMLGISLIFNYFIFEKVENLQNDINYLQSNWDSLDSSVDRVNNRITHAMTEFEKEQRWISPVIQEVESRKIKLSWQVKDYIEDTPVYFYYRLPNENTFTEVLAKPSGGGGFMVGIPFKMEPEPQWYVSISYEDNRSMSVQHESKESNQEYNINYYISVKEGDRIRSSEETSIRLNVNKLNTYSFLDVNVGIQSQNKQYDVSLIEFTGEEPKVKIKKAILEVYQKNEIIAKKELEKQSNSNDNYSNFNVSWFPNEQSFDKVLIKVEYDNGKAFERDITGN